MLTTIPPWLDISPAFFTNAASTGARLGLERAGLETGANEAAQRLQLGYAQLASENARAGQSANAAAAAQALENSQFQSKLQQSGAEFQAGLQQSATEEADKRSAAASLDRYRTGELQLETQKFQTAQKDKQNLMKETSSLFGELSDAQNPQDQLKVLAKHPNAAEALHSGVLSDFVQKPSQPPASVKLVDEIQKTEQQANDAFSKGDTTTGQQLRDRAALLREQTKGQEVVTGYDDQGRPIVRVGKGVGSGAATVATQSQAQQKLIRYENSIELMNHLGQVLKPEHLGAAGVAGEWILDRSLSQLVPELTNKDRVDARSALIALREGLSREMADDRGRFSAADREEIMRALPSNGVFESLPDATQRLATVRGILIQRARNYSQAVGQSPPLWTMTPDEIKALFKSGKIDQTTAVNALTRFY